MSVTMLKFDILTVTLDIVFIIIVGYDTTAASIRMVPEARPLRLLVLENSGLLIKGEIATQHYSYK